jgi:uncharacterized membrane protein
MATRASIRNHPIHPMLIVLPLGLWVFAVVCYAIYLIGAPAVWRTVSLYAMAGGVIGGVLAAIPGMCDFLTLPMSRVQTIALAHMILNIVAITIFLISLILAILWKGHQLGAFILSVCGLAIACVGGWLGGSLVYEHGVGVVSRDGQELMEKALREHETTVQ